MCFGTADAIQVRGDQLRIHDLKTGPTPAKMEQLIIYAALFYLEYGFKPERFRTELRIYQMGDILRLEPEVEKIREVMNSIVQKDRVLQSLKEV
jgi:RecB family exonuclease